MSRQHKVHSESNFANVQLISSSHNCVRVPDNQIALGWREP